MALIKTPQKNNDQTLHDFSLKNVDGKMVSLGDVQGKNGTLIMFICNHCPYVLGIVDRLMGEMKILQDNGIGVVAIMPNDTDNYPADSYENMQKFARKHGFAFPYLIDDTQGVARAYDAVCTPDFFGFNADGTLQYRGRLDSAGHKPADKNTVSELRDAMLQVAKTGTTTAQQTPSMGCSIKWK